MVLVYGPQENTHQIRSLNGHASRWVRPHRSGICCLPSGPCVWNRTVSWHFSVLPRFIRTWPSREPTRLSLTLSQPTVTSSAILVALSRWMKISHGHDSWLELSSALAVTYLFIFTPKHTFHPIQIHSEHLSLFFLIHISNIANILSIKSCRFRSGTVLFFPFLKLYINVFTQVMTRCRPTQMGHWVSD